MENSDNNLGEAIKEKEYLYEEIEYQGQKDIFKLLENYFQEIEKFVKHGIKKGFIT